MQTHPEKILRASAWRYSRAVDKHESVYVNTVMRSDIHSHSAAERMPHENGVFDFFFEQYLYYAVGEIFKAHRAVDIGACSVAVKIDKNAFVIDEIIR